MSLKGTINFHEYQTYKKLKREFLFDYKGIDLVKACAVDLVDIIVVHQKKDYRELIWMLTKKIDTTSLTRAFESKNVILTSDVPKRKDHIHFANLIQQSISDSTLHILKYKTHLKIDFWNLIRIMIILNKNTKSLKISFYNRFFISVRLWFFQKLINDLGRKCKTLDLRGKKYIPYNSSAYNEALITQFFRQKGITTFHIFHGVFGNYIHKIPNDIINGENITAEYVLPFGEIAKKILNTDFSIEKEKLYIAGNPKYPRKKISIKNTFKKGLILGGIGLYDKDFELLLPILNEVAGEENISFLLKPHPISNIQNSSVLKKCTKIQCISKLNSVIDLFKSGEFDFAVTFNTATYYECMYYGIIPLRWAKNENLNFEGFNDRFTDKDSFLNRIDEFRGKNTNEFGILVEELLEKALGMGLNNYNSIVQRLN